MTHVPAAGWPQAAAFSAGGAMCNEKWDLQHTALSLRQTTNSKHLLSLQSHLYLGFSIKNKTKQKTAGYRNPRWYEKEGAEVWEGMSLLPATSPSAEIRQFSQ